MRRLALTRRGDGAMNNYPTASGAAGMPEPAPFPIMMPNARTLLSFLALALAIHFLRLRRNRLKALLVAEVSCRASENPPIVCSVFFPVVS